MAEFIGLAVSIINITKHEKIIRRTTEQNIEIFCLLGINTEKPNLKKKSRTPPMQTLFNNSIRITSISISEEEDLNVCLNNEANND